MGPIANLGHFESTAEIFFVYIALISLARGPILIITSWFAKVLHGLSYLPLSHLSRIYSILYSML
jgi:hypothetical protein